MSNVLHREMQLHRARTRGNRTVELSVDAAVPVDCDVVIPVNIIPQIPEEAVARALEAFRCSRAQLA